MTYRHLLLSLMAEGVTVVTLNRPQVRNAVNQEMQAEIESLLTGLEGDDSVRAIVFTGAGEAAFSAGYDIHEMQNLSGDELLNLNLRREPWLWQVANCPKPLIGAINGVAYGAGAIMATAFDLRIGCSRSAFRYTGAAFNGANNTWHLPPIVGWAKAKEFLLTARLIGAEEALEAGLLNHLVADEAVLTKAVEIATLIAANPPDGVRWTKKLMHENLGRRYEDAYRAENAVMTTELRPKRPDELFGKFLSVRGKKDR